MNQATPAAVNTISTLVKRPIPLALDQLPAVAIPAYPQFPPVQTGQSRMKDYKRFITNVEFETDTIPRVLAEIGRQDARRAQKLSESVSVLPKRIYTKQGVVGATPPANLTPAQNQAWRDARCEQLGWVAGVLDGEGCISAIPHWHPDRKNPSIRIRIDVVQNDENMLARLRAILNCGGHLNPVTRQSNQNRRCYQFTLDGTHAIRALLIIRRLLERKRNEAHGCIQLWIDGELTRCPGRHGIAPHIVDIRNYWVKRIKEMK